MTRVCCFCRKEMRLDGSTFGLVLAKSETESTGICRVDFEKNYGPEDDNETEETEEELACLA